MLASPINVTRGTSKPSCNRSRFRNSMAISESSPMRLSDFCTSTPSTSETHSPRTDLSAIQKFRGRILLRMEHGPARGTFIPAPPLTARSERALLRLRLQCGQLGLAAQDHDAHLARPVDRP